MAHPNQGLNVHSGSRQEAMEPLAHGCVDIGERLRRQVGVCSFVGHRLVLRHEESNLSQLADDLPVCRLQLFDDLGGELGLQILIEEEVRG